MSADPTIETASPLDRRIVESVPGIASGCSPTAGLKSHSLAAEAGDVARVVIRVGHRHLRQPGRAAVVDGEQLVRVAKRQDRLLTPFLL